MAATKTLIRTLPTLPDEQKMRFAAENFTDCLKGEEGKEGVASFLEKRKPIGTRRARHDSNPDSAGGQSR